MADEANVVAANAMAPETVQPAQSAEPVVDAPVASDAAPAPEGAEKEKPSETKTYSKDELERIVAKERAREQRKAQRDADRRIAEALAQHQPKTVAPAAPDKPKPENFQTTEDYVEAVAGWKAEQIVAATMSQREKQESERRQQAEAETRTHAWADQEAEAEDKYDDYIEVTRNPKLRINDVMAAVIQESETGTELAYFLGKNPQEAERIAKLAPHVAAKELGKLEAKLSTTPVVKRTSSAPAPIAPLRGNASTASAEPQDSDSIEVWLAKRNAQVKARMQSRRII